MLLTIIAPVDIFQIKFVLKYEQKKRLKDFALDMFSYNG